MMILSTWACSTLYTTTQGWTANVSLIRVLNCLVFACTTYKYNSENFKVGFTQRSLVCVIFWPVTEFICNRTLCDDRLRVTEFMSRSVYR